MQVKTHIPNLSTKQCFVPPVLGVCAWLCPCLGLQDRGWTFLGRGQAVPSSTCRRPTSLPLFSQSYGPEILARTIPAQGFRLCFGWSEPYIWFWLFMRQTVFTIAFLIYNSASCSIASPLSGVVEACCCCLSGLSSVLWCNMYKMLIEEVHWKRWPAPLKLCIQSAFLHFAPQQVNPSSCFVPFHWDQLQRKRCVLWQGSGRANSLLLNSPVSQSAGRGPQGETMQCLIELFCVHQLKLLTWSLKLQE